MDGSWAVLEQAHRRQAALRLCPAVSGMNARTDPVDPCAILWDPVRTFPGVAERCGRRCRSHAGALQCSAGSRIRPRSSRVRSRQCSAQDRGASRRRTVPPLGAGRMSRVNAPASVAMAPVGRAPGSTVVGRTRSFRPPTARQARRHPRGIHSSECRLIGTRYGLHRLSSPVCFPDGFFVTVRNGTVPRMRGRSRFASFPASHESVKGGRPRR